jgi:hypothetical protein
MKNFNKLVDAVNYLYEYIPLVVTEVKNQLEPHIGKPIFKTDGTWRKSVNWEYKPIQKQLPNGDFLSVQYYVRQYSNYVDLTVKICLNGGSYDVYPSTAFTIYQEAGITIYTTDDEGNLVEYDVDLDQWNQRFDFDTLVKQAEVVNIKAKELKNEIDKVSYRFREALYLPSIR